jgi:MFS family permease
MIVGRILRPYTASVEGLPRSIWMLFWVTLINRSGTMVLPFLALFLTRERGMSIGEAGQLLSLYGLGALIGAFVGGWLSDHIGPVKAQQASLVSGGLSYLAFLFVDKPVALAVAIFTASLLAEAVRPGIMAATAENAPAGHQVRAFALIRLGANLGMSVGPAMGGLLAAYSYDWIFIADAATCWLAAVFLTRFMPSRKARVESDEQDTAPAISPFRDGPFLAFLLLVFVIAVVIFQIMGTMPLFFHEHYGMPERSIGLLLGLNAGLIVIFELPISHRAERSGRLFGILGLGCFLVCLGFAVLPLGTGALIAAASITVWTFGEMLAFPLFNAIVARRAGEGQRGRYMGLYTAAFAAALILAPVGGTWVYDRFGPSSLWYGIGALGPLLWIAALAFSRLLDTAPRASRPA